jgi:hypothetical protein
VCIITDPAMDPFYISKDNSNFTVIEKTTVKRGFRGAVASGKDTENVIGYYSNFRNALNAVAKQKFHTNTGEYNTIKEYIASWNEVKDGIESLLNTVNF